METQRAFIILQKGLAYIIDTSIRRALVHTLGNTYPWGGGGGRTHHVAEGHCKGEGAGGECAPSCMEREAETTFILQSEWEGPLTVAAVYVALSMEKKISSPGQGGDRPPPLLQ